MSKTHNSNYNENTSNEYTTSLLKLLDHCSRSSSCFHCVVLTVDAADSAVSICSRAHFCQAREEDLKGQKRRRKARVMTTKVHMSPPLWMVLFVSEFSARLNLK